MTKKDLIEFLKNYPDDTIIQYNTGHGRIYDASIVDWFDCFPGRKAVLISGDYGDD